VSTKPGQLQGSIADLAGGGALLPLDVRESVR
jgi:hypothetical protein